MKYHLVFAAAAVLSLWQPLAAQPDWTTAGHDAGQTKYSPLDQINTTNVSKLEQAWVYHITPVVLPAAAPGAKPIKRSSQAIPLIVNDVMYMTTPYSSVIALQPETGKLIWSYKLEQSSVQGRSLAFWPGDKTTPASLLFGTADGRMVSISAHTGKPTASFGDHGIISLRRGMDQRLGPTEDAQRYYMTSPGSIYKGLIITGSDVQETPGRGPSGDIRAWDLHTGKLVWTFHTVPREGEFGNDTWPADGWQARSGTNMWGFSSVDPKLGLVFVPTGSATSDNWGGDREGHNLFANCLLAINADTGKLVWYFQAVHHDLFDYDLESAPVLITIHRKTGDIPGVAVTSKTGLLYIFNRRNGTPIYGVEERPVPQSTAPGEHSSSTQPFPIKPVQLGRGGYDPQVEGVAKVTPEHQAFCEKMLATEGGMVGSTSTFTPYGEKLTIIFPSTVGISNWYGMSYNPKLGYLFINTNDMGSIGKIAPTKPGTDPPYDRTSPWGTYAEFSEGSKEWPCQPPPWGQLWAIDVNTGDVAWKHPFGTIPELDAIGVHDTGSLNYGGSIATGGGLLFIAASIDQHFHAFEAKTGKLLWDIKMDTGAYTAPSTYLGRDGRQYVVILDSGGGFFDKTNGDSLIAYALPKNAVQKAPAQKPAAQKLPAKK